MAPAEPGWWHWRRYRHDVEMISCPTSKKTTILAFVQTFPWSPSTRYCQLSPWTSSLSLLFQVESRLILHFHTNAPSEKSLSRSKIPREKRSPADNLWECSPERCSLCTQIKRQNQATEGALKPSHVREMKQPTKRSLYDGFTHIKTCWFPREYSK